MAARSQTDYIKRALDRQSVFRTAVLYRTVLETMLDISLTTFLLALTSVLYYDNMTSVDQNIRLSEADHLSFLLCAASIKR